jgi:hypothetical protein
MLTHRRRRLAGLVAAIAVLLSAGPVAHQAAESARHTRAVLADPICPNGTNWNNLLHACR